MALKTLADPRKPRPNTLVLITNGLWALFLVWTLVGLLIVPFNINDYNIADFTSQPHLISLGKWLLPLADAIWVTLAGITTYFLMVRMEGLDRGRTMAGVILIVAAALELLNAATGLPFGKLLYTDNMGARVFGLMPFTIPFAWLAILGGFRQLLVQLNLPWNRWGHAALIAALAVITDLNLEQIAWKVRQYWIWYPGRIELPYPEWPPLQNFISWFILAFALAATFPRPRGGFPPQLPAWQLGTIPLIINLLFLVTHVFGWLGWRV